MTFSSSDSNSSADTTRRQFVGNAVAGIAATSALNAGLFAAEPGQAEKKQVTVGIMGVSRGSALARVFAKLEGVKVRYLCDTDSIRLKSAHESFAKTVDYDVRTTGDFRHILDDKNVDALIVAAPNHWHAPAGIMACAAGKHAYVEKPCCHNPAEGEMLIAAARKHKRCVQMGNQRRSGAKIVEAISLLHEGRIGRVYYSRSWYANLRGPMGTGMPEAVPDHIDYELWQGPAPRTPYQSNIVHYNWHWRWHFGNGELGNNGIHSLDLSRWGLDADYPERVTSSGGRYRFEDDQQTADTHLVSFEFPGKKQIIWEGLSCNRDGFYGDSFGVSFHGEKGSLRMNSWGYTLYDEKTKEIQKVDGQDGLEAHASNFIEAIRADDPTMLNSEIEEGYKSTLLCHLGNIAHRTGDTINVDPSNGHVIANPEADKLWARTYEPGWEPKF
ncbi:MAG: Gfo/Idh/MocA family oxidoreductase [Planctomycetaceae bacterium]|nr:Gfo/Idh/MocA family oxidoreductase [Planctomycetaceae bacterium]